MNELVLMVSVVTGPLAIVLLILRRTLAKRVRLLLKALIPTALLIVTWAVYQLARALPPSGVGPEVGPQDAPVLAVLNGSLAAALDLLVLLVSLLVRAEILRWRRNKRRH